MLLFGLWYWELDRGGPIARRTEPEPPDFLFPQMDVPGQFEGWEPNLIDYLYVSFTNATAFSPTDAMPLSRPAKVLMAVQATAALVTIGLVVARAVNILVVEWPRRMTRAGDPPGRRGARGGVPVRRAASDARARRARDGAGLERPRAARGSVQVRRRRAGVPVAR